MGRCISKIKPFFVIGAVLLWLSSLVFAQISPEQERKVLEEELKKLEAQIEQYEMDITKTKQEKQTLQNKIYSLKKEIEKLDLQITKQNIMIKDLDYQIRDTEKSIETTEQQIEKYRQRLAHILRVIYQEDQKSLFEILISEPKFSNFFAALVSLERIGAENKKLLANIKNLKGYLEKQRTSLSSEKKDLEHTVSIQMLQKEQNARKKQEQEYYLRITDAEYARRLQEKEAIEKRAAEIRARLFELIGVIKAPTFGEAVEIAKATAAIINVRPALLLGVLSQESAIGKNVGQCYLKNPKTGNGVNVSTGAVVNNVMKPSRDVQPFLQITQELGRDPFATPVSCPIPSVGGYGGAMGPAQFIPSTWMLYKDRLAAILNKTPDPWNIKDSFLAAALYLADFGATKQTENDEWKAAMIYFSGSTNPRYRFYGDQVLERTACAQTFIDQGTMSYGCELLLLGRK